MTQTKPYSLSKSRSIMKHSYAWYKKRGKTLSSSDLVNFEEKLKQLDAALLGGDRNASDTEARWLEQFCDARFKKSFFDYTKELVVALVLALVIATVIRQMWFENYEIPTGSMRPTFMEQDHLTVSKTQFGLNVPLKTNHFMFETENVQRTSIFIFSAEGMAIKDINTSYFWVLPYTKRLIKRCMGKPGDSLYFYGGHIYAVDKEGNELKELIDGPWMKNVEYIPFLRFEGEITAQQSTRQITFKQMNMPVGRITLMGAANTRGQVFNGTDWVEDKPLAQREPHNTIQTYTDFIGIRNYAMARLLTKRELENYSTANTEGLEDGVLYLELRHNPSMTYPKPQIRSDNMGTTVALTPFASVIPLQKHHLKAIMENMYTCRFIVKDGRARRYQVEGPYTPLAMSPPFAGIPDGSYEFYYGKGYKVGWGAITSLLPDTHPLYSLDPENVQNLYNQGIEMNTLVDPHSKTQEYFPNRYAYFRDGDLYLLGAPVIKKEDPSLTAFHAREKKMEEQSSPERPYAPFKDYGAPVKEGKYDVAFIRTFGVTIPEKHYVALGDNHAMSGDSRSFGFVPEDNIQGVPCIIMWPPGDRLGHPPQKPYPLLTEPRLIVWVVVAFILAVWYAIHRRNIRRPIFRA